MNIYRQMAENVWNPRVQSGADIQRMLDMMDRFQGGPVTSNIGSAMDDREGYRGESAPQGPAMQGQMSDDPNSMSIALGALLGPQAASLVGGKTGRNAFNEAFPSPTTFGGKALSKLGSPAMNFFTGIPSFFTDMAMRQFVNPLIAFIENQLGLGMPDLGSMGFGTPSGPVGMAMGSQGLQGIAGQAMGLSGMQGFGLGPMGLGLSPSFGMSAPGQGTGVGSSAPDMSMSDAMGMLGMDMEGQGASMGMGDTDSGGEGMGMW